MPISSSAASEGISALVKFVASSIPMKPKANQKAAQNSVGIPGTAHHSTKAPVTYMTENSQIHGILRPRPSAMTPRTGARMAMMIPVTVWVAVQ